MDSRPISEYREYVKQTHRCRGGNSVCEANMAASMLDMALDELEALRGQQPLFESGDFTLHSGGASGWRINCEALTDADLDTIASVMADRIGPVSGVEGVPSGGLRFAAALRKVVKLDAYSPVLIVDDVLTTGESMETHKGIRDAVGVVLFARGKPPSWVEPVWSFDVSALRGQQERVRELPDELRGDGPCDDCGTLDNPVWFTLNVLWNEVRDEQEKFGGESFSIVCPQCFIRRAGEVGVRHGWLLIPGWPYEVRRE